MFWASKLTGKQPLRLTEGPTQILIITNACMVPSTLPQDQKVRLLLRTNKLTKDKHVIAELSPQNNQVHLQLFMSLTEQPELSLSSKSAQMHLIGYFYPTPVDVEESSSEEDADDKAELSSDSELQPIRKQKQKNQ